jgi:hypothetical protein
MPLFLLRPVDRNAGEWAFSTTNEPVQIEAETELRARRRANLFFAVRGRVARSTARPSGASPWDQRHLVIAREIEEADPAVRLILAGDTPP